MKNIFIIILFLFATISFAQKSTPVYKVTYESFSNGKKTNGTLDMYCKNNMVFLSKATDKIRNYIDLKNSQNISTLTYQDSTFKNVTPFSELPKPTIVNDSEEKILGYQCHYASYSFFSNTIEVWYTENAPIQGAPYNRYLPSKKALVLKILINGNREIKASSIKKIKSEQFDQRFPSNAKQVNEAEFEELKINSRYTQVSVFENEIINFNPKLEVPKASTLQANKTYHFSNGSVIMKKIKITPYLKNNPYVFAKLTCKSNGDAYDRTGSVFIIPVSDNKKTTMLDAYLNGLKELPVYTDHLGNTYQGIRQEENYIPSIEILRFFTSFGVSNFNTKREINNYNWAQEATYKEEVSSLFPNDVEYVWVGVFIGNYDSGGHVVNLELDFYPNEDPNTSKNTKYINPLFSTVNTMEMSGQNYGRLFANDTLHVTFKLEKDIQNLNLLYTSTGHGGWEGGDEFNPKLNRLLIDGKEIYKVVPWRTDCATYRLYNPASGNFSNGLSSSDLSRSNWCPASLTTPYVIPLDNLKEGTHTIEVIINQGKDEGSSFNHWSVTGILVGEKTNN